MYMYNIKMKKKSKFWIGYIFVVKLLIGFFAGFGVFWYYILFNWNIFFSIFVACITSSITFAMLMDIGGNQQ